MSYICKFTSVNLNYTSICHDNFLLYQGLLALQVPKETEVFQERLVLSDLLWVLIHFITDINEILIFSLLNTFYLLLFIIFCAFLN